jgi:hypothetical protein
MQPQIALSGFRWTFPLWVFGGISCAMILVFAATIAFWVVDSRVIDGVSVWAKPVKFELALAIHAGTLALVVSRLSPSFQAGPFMQGATIAFLAACTIEMGWIIFQASQGQHSHFNDTTAFHRAMFSVMAFAAVIITGAAAAVAFQVLRDPDFAAGALLKTGILLGLTGGTILTLVTALAIGGKGSPYVEDMPLLTSRMMFTGWSLTGGDLRVAHFLATHMMQAVPIAALIIVRSRTGVFAPYVVALFAALWTTWTLAEFSVARSGEPALILSMFR